MRFRSIALTLLSVAAAGTAGAQTPSDQCPPGSFVLGIPDRQKATQDACQQAIDLFQYMAPQLGIAIAGGNATLAQGGALGGFPHFTIGLRANVLAGEVPEVQVPETDGALRRDPYPTNNAILGLPAVDASIGIFKGLPLAVSNVGGVDLLLSASYVPKITKDNVSIEPDTPLQIGYGVRVGILQESLLVPGIGVTILQRGLPKTTIVGTSADDSLRVIDLNLKTTAWRLTASKSLILFTIAAGVGQDRYNTSTTIEAVVNDPLFGRAFTDPISVEQKMTRTNYFADLSMNLLLFKLVGEVGMVSGGNVATFSTFEKAADASRLYGSVGVRFGF